MVNVRTRLLKFCLASSSFSYTAFMVVGSPLTTKFIVFLSQKILLMSFLSTRLFLAFTNFPQTVNCLLAHE